jgi:hypothetical protein
MYLYNGHRAPGLPVYDPAVYPYGLIVSANGDNTSLILMLCVNRPYYGVNPQDRTQTGVYNTGRMLVYTCTDTDKAWTFSLETENPLTANDDDPGGGVLWTLEDILKTDGSVWMAGTQPVPERVSEAWVRSFLEGLALGLTGAPLPYGGTEPVAYLYNGVRLPKLPELDKTVYPYAYIIYAEALGGYRLILQQTYVESYDYNGETKVRENYDPSWTDYKAETGSQWATRETYIDTDDGWAFGYSKSYTADMYPTNILSEYVWTNYDIANSTSGNVDLPASDPIPVYE